MKYLFFTTAIFSILLFASCSKDYNIQLPPNESKLVIECYLEDGEPLRVLVSESAALLDTSTIPPVLIAATVVITHGNDKDTLLPFSYVDRLRRRAYNYGSNKIIYKNNLPETDYRIDVTDNKGRHANGITRFINPVAIDSLIPTFNNENKAFCITKFKDDPAITNYYRLVLTRNALYDSINLDVVIDNSFANNSHEIVYGSGYNFQRGDSVYACLYHLTHDYYLYLNTLQNARTALVNPFAVSGEIVSNIKGGLGVFAALSYTRKSVIVP